MSKINHAVGVIVGRFQVPYLHEGHEHLFREAKDRLRSLAETHTLVIGLGISPLRGDKKNPLTFAMRKDMLDAFLQDRMNYLVDDYSIIPVLDQVSNDDWYRDLSNLVTGTYPNTKIYYIGSRDSWVDDIILDTAVIAIPPINGRSATQVREEILNSKPSESGEFRTGVIYGVLNRWDHVNATVDILPIIDNAYVLLGRKPGETAWRFPGGFSDVQDEDFASAALRELQEETGIEPNNVDLRYIFSKKIHDWRYKGSSDGIITTLFAAHVISTTTFSPADDLAELELFTLNEFRNVDINPTHKPLHTRSVQYLKDKGLL